MYTTVIKLSALGKGVWVQEKDGKLGQMCVESYTTVVVVVLDSNEIKINR